MAIAPTSSSPMGLAPQQAFQPVSASTTPAAAPTGRSTFDIGSFLTEGRQIPQGSALQASTGQTILPEWYTNYAQQLLANQQAVMNRPFPLAPMPRVAEFNQTQQQGFDMTGQAAGAFQPNLAQATQATQGVLGSQGALGAAQPFINNAAQTSVSNIGTYMNPFQDQVVDRIGELGARNLRERIMPEIEGRYIAAGQLGFGGRQPGSGTPSGMLTDTARAVRDVSDDVLARQADVLRGGFTEAAGLAGTDLARQGALAQTAGGFAGQDLARNLGGAQQLAGLGALQQQLGLTGAGALGQIGNQQQQQVQQNLNVAFEDFMRQQNFPQEQIDAALRTFQGVASGVPAAKEQFGIVPSGQPAQFAPSTASTIAGGLAGAAGLLKSLGLI
jgi:hypothetical protein